MFWHWLNIQSFHCLVCGKYVNSLLPQPLTLRASEAQNSRALMGQWVSLHLMDANNLGFNILIDLDKGFLSQTESYRIKFYSKSPFCLLFLTFSLFDTYTSPGFSYSILTVITNKLRWVLKISVSIYFTFQPTKQNLSKNNKPLLLWNIFKSP